MKISKKQIKISIFVFIPILIILGAWFFYRETRLVLSVPINSWSEDHIADCAVVLTGSAGRVREGFDLLSRKSIRKLIVAGVHPQATLREIFPRWPYYENLSHLDVILEKRSRTTFGNAQQTLPLVEALHCHDVVLITSQWHMYRSKKTFQAIYPQDVTIIAHAISSGVYWFQWYDVAFETLKSIFYSVWVY